MRLNFKKIIPILLGAIYLILPVKAIYAETLEEQINNLVGPKEQYNTMLSPVYLRNNTTEESISPQSGEMTMSQTDYVLQGVHGLDLEFKRIYKSGSSNIQDMKVKYVNGSWVDYIYSDANTSSFYEDRYDLGVGMRFSFPGIEVKTNDDGSKHMFLHTEAGDVYPLKKNTASQETVYLPENQTIKDVEIKETNEYSNGQTDGVSKYRMVGKDGKKTYFSEDGRVLGIVDRYGSTIKFEYSTQTYQVDSTSRTKKLISKITDTIGRVVTIDYKEDYSYAVGAIENNSYTLDDSYKASQNPNTTDSGDLKSKFQVVINLPDGKKIIYDKSAALVSSSKHVIRTRLQRVFDIDGKPKYHFWYDQPELGFTYTNGTTYSAFNRYENLIQIDYCKTDRIKRYTYDKFNRGLSDKGSMEYQKAFEQKELVKKGFDNSKTQFIDKYITDVKDKNTYKYTNEADGFGTTGYKENDNAYLKDTYSYSTEKTDMGGNKTNYVYNGIHELVKNESLGVNHKEEYVTEYDEMKFPKKKEVISYNLENGQNVKKIENFRYDEYGNLTNYTGPLAKRDEKGYPVDNENTVVYSYAYDKYHTPILKTWKQNENTTCQIINTVDDKGNVTKEQKVLTSDPRNWVTTEYQYDSHGNITKKTVNSTENTYIANYEYGVDADGADTKGAYLTKEYSVENGIELSKKYSYDLAIGNKKADIDANGSRTDYAYDTLGRLIKTINPDKTEKTFSYLEYVNQDKQIEFTDANGTKYQNTYDILGNLLKSCVYLDNKWNILKEVEYDYRGNKIKEKDSNGNSSRFEYDSAGLLVSKSFFEKDQVKKADISLKYTLAYDTETQLLLTITDEEGYSQRYYYNIANQMLKSESTADKTNYSAVSYSYDYVGNKVSTTDPLGNKTLFSYDELGRLLKKTDAASNETSYTYNSLDKAMTVSEPNDRKTTYVYDVLGRVDEERVSKNGSADYVYKKYSYDATGNVLSVIQAEVKAGKDTLASKTEYKYDTMNRVTDEYRTIDDTRKAHIKYTYDNNGNKTSSTEYIDKDEKQYISYSYKYDFVGRQISEEGISQDAAEDGTIATNSSYKTMLQRDLAGNVLKEQKYNGTGYDETSYTYDYRNKPLTKTEPYKDGAVKTTELSYDKKGNIKSQLTTVSGEKVGILYQYDGLGRVIRKADTMGNTSSYLFDANGNLKKEVDPRYQTVAMDTAPGIEYEYDALNRQTKTIAFDGANRTVISYKEYDGRGNVTKEADAAGYNAENPVASFGILKEYDALNNVVKIVSPEIAKNNSQNGTVAFTKKFTYDGAGRLIAEEDAANCITQYEYYLNGKLKKKTDPDSTESSFDYDLTGKVMVKATDKAKNVITTFSNIFGKPYRVEYPDNTTEFFYYSPKGEVTEARDKAGNTKYFAYDASGNMTKKKEYIGKNGTNDIYSLTVNTFDEANKVVATETFRVEGDATVSAGNKVEYSYDKAGRNTKISGPNGREAIKEYDGKGSLLTEKAKVRDGYYDAKRYTYDLLGRVLSESVLVEVQDIDLAKLTAPEFDNEFGSRVKSTAKYTYYPNGQLKAKKDANGNETSFVYDLDKHVIEKNEKGIGSQTYKYDNRGNLIEQTNSLKVATSFDYDSMGRMIRKNTPAADGSMAVNLYIYDVNGNLKKTIAPNDYKQELDTPEKSSQMLGISYEYDSMNRKVATISPDGSILEKIKYNALGKVEKTVDGLRLTGDFDKSPGTSYTYDGLGRVLQKTDALGNTSAYEYDVLGNVIKETDPRGNSTQYQYAPDGTMVLTSFADGTKVEYAYDKLGRKTSVKDQRGFVTQYSYTAFGKLKSEKDPNGNTATYVYDLNGNVLSQKDKRDNVTYYSYDSMNRVASKKTPLELDAAGNVVYATESYNYDSEGNVIKKTASGTANPDVKKEIYYSYYPNNLVKTVSDSSGASKTSYYDKNGNVTKTETLREDGLFDTEKYEYDNMNRMMKKIVLVDEKAFSLDGMDTTGVKDIAFPGMILLISGFSYDIMGNKKKEYSPMAFAFAEGSPDREKYAVDYTYDALNRLEKVTRKNGDADVSTQYFYDEVGNKTKVVNELGNETLFSYDKRNRLSTQTDSYGNTFSFKYDEAGNKTEEKNAKGDTISYSYDSLNRVDTIKDAFGAIIKKNIYDANGNVIKAIDGKGYLSADNDGARYGTLYTYDMANRVTMVVDPELAAAEDSVKFSFKYTYNQFSEKLGSIDALGNTTSYEYDNAGRLAKVTMLGKETVNYGYDRAGNKLYMVDGRGKITRYSYGPAKLVKTVIDADGKEINYRYNLNGNVAETLDRNGNTTQYIYDNRNLLVQKKVKETGDSVSFSYDAASNRVAMKDESGETTYTYDKNNKVTDIAKDGAKELSYTYDSVGNIETVTDSKGFTTSYSYDKSNRMKTVSFSGNTTTYSYDVNGNRESVEYQGGVKESYTYDKNNKLVELTNTKPDGGIISKYSYTYYENGLQKTKTDKYGTTSYSYDGAGRVEKVTTPGKTTVYAYDKAGNRLSQNETYTSAQPTGTIDEASGLEIQYTVKKSEYVYDNTNQLVKLTEKMFDNTNKEVLQKTTTYYYDANGNQLNQNSSFIAPHSFKKRQSTKGSAQGDDADSSISTLVDRTSNTFDGFNRLKEIESVKDGVRTLAKYTYNGDDLRVKKSVKKSDDGYTEKITNYLYDRQYVILETDAGNAVKARYIRGVNYVARLDASNSLSYFLYNGHGDVVQTVTAVGEVQNQYDYDIWGNPTLSVEAYDCGIRYAGEYFDSESGLYYLRARYYDSYIGRFVSEDSYWGEDENPLSLNRYTYVNNNPIKYVDPSGHFGILGGILGGFVQAALPAISSIISNITSTTSSRDDDNNASSSSSQNTTSSNSSGSTGTGILSILKSAAMNVLNILNSTVQGSNSKNITSTPVLGTGFGMTIAPPFASVNETKSPSETVIRDAVPGRDEKTGIETNLVIGGVAIGNAVYKNDKFSGNLRDVVNGLGGKIESYNGDTNTAIVNINGKTFVFNIEERKYYEKINNTKGQEYDFTMNDKNDRIIIGVRDFIRNSGLESMTKTEYREPEAGRQYANIIPTTETGVTYNFKVFSRATGVSEYFTNTAANVNNYVENNNWTSIPQQKITFYTNDYKNSDTFGEFYVDPDWTTAPPPPTPVYNTYTGEKVEYTSGGSIINRYTAQKAYVGNGNNGWTLDAPSEGKVIYNKTTGEPHTTKNSYETRTLLNSGNYVSYDPTKGTGNTELERLCEQPITSTWGISDSTVEEWFLKQNSAQPVIKRYGLNSTNIKDVTAAVKAAGVSPVFFYTYTVNEGGGEGGFINHWGKSYYKDNGGDTAINAATGDAKYLVDESKNMNGEPAWIDLGNYVDFVPQSVKNSGNASYKNMLSGSIGRVYIAATAATTWEVYYPNGLKKEYNKIQNYGAPLQGVMNSIKAMGGNP